MLAPMVGMPNGIIMQNGGVRCDMLFGPCSCGAWHGIRDKSANDSEDIYRVYIFFLLKGEK